MCELDTFYLPKPVNGRKAFANIHPSTSISELAERPRMNRVCSHLIVVIPAYHLTPYSARRGRGASPTVP